MTDMSKELKALKLAHAVEKQIMQDNFTQCKTAAEYLKTENNNLRCCGNCKHIGQGYEDYYCELNGHDIQPNHYCDQWQTDGLSREEREGK
jgi:hypothetical protein